MIKDSIFKKFNEHFNMKSQFDNSLFNEFFYKDSYVEDEFFRGNFKRKKIMEQMMQRMDSLKNQFFMEEFPLKEEEKE